MTTTDDKPMTVDVLMDMAFALEIAARDYRCAPDKYLQQELIDARAELRAAIEQYGREQYARGVNDAWPAGRGSGEPARRWPFVETPGQFAERMREALRDFGGDMLAACRYCLIESPPTIARHQSHEPLTDEQIDRHTLLAQECPPGSKVILVSSLRRLHAHGIRSEG